VTRIPDADEPVHPDGGFPHGSGERSWYYTLRTEDDVNEMQATEQHEEVQETPSNEELLVSGWRFEQFTALGFSLTQVAQLVYSSVDLNTARTMIRGGCTPNMAADILL
jgi:hypothetical protein